MRPTAGSLFTGCGGIDLGLTWAGFDIKWQVELQQYERDVLAKRFPDAEQYIDVRHFPPKPESTWLLQQWKKRFYVDLLAAGFPCQDISYAGKGAGLKGEQSSLFYEAIRVVRILGPRFVLLENVAGLLTRGVDQVLGTLASIGYDAEWHCIPAAYVGAPHIRDRAFILAYSNSYGFSRRAESHQWQKEPPQQASQRDHTLRLGVRGRWATEPGVPRVADGVPNRVDRLRCTGNSVMPGIAEILGMKFIEMMYG